MRLLGIIRASCSHYFLCVGNTQILAHKLERLLQGERADFLMTGLSLAMSGADVINFLAHFSIFSLTFSLLRLETHKALDDAQGAAALTQAIDNAGPYDFFGVVEAAGNTPAGAFPAWTKQSKSLDGMQSLSGKSGFETIALFYNASKWTGKLIQVGEFESGRPFLLAQFSSDRCDALYIMVVHLVSATAFTALVITTVLCRRTTFFCTIPTSSTLSYPAV